MVHLDDYTDVKIQNTRQLRQYLKNMCRDNDIMVGGPGNAINKGIGIAFEDMNNGEKTRIGIQIGSESFPILIDRAGVSYIYDRISNIRDNLISRNIVSINDHEVYCIPMTSGVYNCSRCGLEIDLSNMITSKNQLEWVYGYFLENSCQEIRQKLTISKDL